MKEISSNSTYTTKYLLPLILAVAAIILIGYMIFSNHNIKDFTAPVVVLLLAVFVWFVKYRKLEIVYIDKNDLIVRNKKILIEDIILMKRIPPNYIYTVKYREGNEIKSFRFVIDSMFLRTPEYMKKLEALVKENNK